MRTASWVLMGAALALAVWGCASERSAPPAAEVGRSAEGAATPGAPSDEPARLLATARDMLAAEQRIAAVLMLNEIVERFGSSAEAREAERMLDALEVAGQ